MRRDYEADGGTHVPGFNYTNGPLWYYLHMEHCQDDVAAVATLNEPSRRRLYEFVRDHGVPVSREVAATATGMSVNLVAFHLDKLVAAGLLIADYGRAADAPVQRGRNPKLYAVSGNDVHASVPPRRYDLPAEILLDAVELQRQGEEAEAAVLRAAELRGHELGRRVRLERSGAEPSPSAVDLAQQVLEEHGFEPYFDQTSTLRLRNCPFHRLAERSRELVCSMNRAFIDGLLRGLGDDLSEASLAPTAGQCCVAISPARRTA